MKVEYFVANLILHFLMLDMNPFHEFLSADNLQMFMILTISYKNPTLDNHKNLLFIRCTYALFLFLIRLFIITKYLYHKYTTFSSVLMQMFVILYVPTRYSISLLLIVL